MADRLAALERGLAAFADAPFAWGAADCLTWIEGYLGDIGLLSWETLPRASVAEARRGLRRLGAQDVAELFDLHFPRVAPMLAVAGDLAALPGDGGWPCAAIISADSCWAMTPAGLRAIGRHHAIAAWRV